MDLTTLPRHSLRRGAVMKYLRAVALPVPETAEELFRRILAEIILLDVEAARERHLPGPGIRISGLFTASSSSTWPSG